MCDNKNNKNVYQQQQTWLLKPLLQLLLLGLLIQQQQQYVVLVNATPVAVTAAAFQPSYIEHGKDALSLISTNLLVQQQQEQQQNVATFDTEDVVDSSLSTARKLLAVDGDSSKVEGSGSAVVGALSEIEDDIVENADADKSANDEDMDRIEFSGYVNDFNIQHEASIPEDILDQQHIEDEQENAEGDGEENIILESQRSTIRNFTSYNNNNSNNNNNNNNNNNENHGNNNKNYNSDVDDDNGSNNYKRKKKKINNNSSNKNQHKKLSYNKDNQHHHHFEISTEIENDEQPNADDNSESFKNEKLKNRQQHHHQQQQQQLDDNVNLNELKFNKLTVVENLNDNEDDDDDDAADVVDFKWNNNNNNKEQQQQQQQYKYDEKQQNDEQEKAIGDIEDSNNFRKETAWEAEITNDNDASAAIAVATGDDNTNNDTDDDEIADATTVPRTTTAKTIVFVGRKTKRHGTALSTQKQQQQEQFIDVADQQYDEEQQQMIYEKQEHSRHHHFNSDSTNNNNMPTLQDDLDQEQREQKLVKPDYSISYFGISTSNGSSSTNTQKDMRVGATNVQSFSMSDSSSSNSKGQDVLKFINEDGVTLSQHSDNVTPTLTAFEQHKAQRRNNRRTGHKSHKKKYKDYLRYVKATATTTTTATITEKPTTIQAPTMAKVVTVEIATIPTAMEEKEVSTDQQQQQQQDRQQQRLAKLKQYKKDIKSMEKSRQLPAASSPIFVLTNRRGNAATTDVLAAGSSSVSEVTIRPYYEGQLSYYMETRDDGDETKDMPGNNVGKLITSETGSNSWYRRMQPILRNGMTKQRDNKQEHKHHHHHQHHIHEHHLKQHQQHGAHHLHQHHHHYHHSQSLQHEHRKHLHEEQQQHQDSDSSDSVGSSQKATNLNKPIQHHAYQRRLSATKKEQQPLYRPLYTPYVPLETPTAPLPPPSYHAAQQQKSSSDGALQELGHQITQMEEFDRYYRKWPHLARVQFQLNDENYRAAHGGALLDANSETEYEYQLAGDELEDEFDNEDDDDEDDDAEDANLPPYIKKYNRRNKQLLNLLEGTLPPPTPPKRIIWSSSVLQPGPRDAAPVRVDDDYIKEKRRRYHKQHNGNAKQWSGNKDLFAEQRDASEKLSDTSVDDDTTATTTTKATVQTAMPRQALNLHVTQDGQQQPSQHPPLNVIPGDDVDVSSSSSQEFDDWEKEIAASVKGSEKMKWQIENSAVATTTVATPTKATTLKPAVFRLPSYPGFAGSFIGKPRSRSSQFAPSSGSSIISSGSSSRLLPGVAGNRVGNSFITNALHSGNYKSAMNTRDSSSISSESNNNIAPPTSVPPSSSVTVAVAAKPLSNSFVYHRVEASPRVVGAGFTGHKQRLPFVAITDRRLETSKKSFALLERQRSDFEQNHYPMP